MHARVYRNIESQSTLLGLAFPSEVLVVLAAAWGFMVALPPGTALLAIAGAYAGVRLFSYGRPPMFLQHWASFWLRRLVGGGVLSAAARSASPRFPHARHRSTQAKGSW